MLPIPASLEKRPAPACACGRLRRASRALTQLYDDAMVPAGLRITQFSLLRTLAREGPLRISDLASHLLLDRTALSRNLDPLVEHGFVEVSTGSDARTREAAMTKKGSATLRAATRRWEEAQKVVAAQLGREKLDALLEVLAELESLHPANRASPQPARRRRAEGSERRNARTNGSRKHP